MNALIFGRRRQGKSTLALALALSRNKPIVIFDPNNQYQIMPPLPVEQVELAMERNAPLTIVQPEAGQMTEEFELLVAQLRNWSNYVVIVDETNSIQSKAALHPGLEWLMRKAPDDVDVIQTTHRPYDTQRLVRALAGELFIFQTTLQADLEVLAREYAPEIADEVSKLGAYECLHYWTEQAGVRKYSIWRKPEAWYVPIG